MAEEADDPLDRLFHAVELGEGRIDPDRAVHEDAAEARVLRGVDELRLADRRQQPLGGAGIHHRIVAATLQILAEGEFVLAASFVGARVFGEEIAGGQHGGRSFMLRRDNTRAPVEVAPLESRDDHDSVSHASHMPKRDRFMNRHLCGTAPPSRTAREKWVRSRERRTNTSNAERRSGCRRGAFEHDADEPTSSFGPPDHVRVV